MFSTKMNSKLKHICPLTLIWFAFAGALSNNKKQVSLVIKWNFNPKVDRGKKLFSYSGSLM